jgi:hypothetical protein
MSSRYYTIASAVASDSTHEAPLLPLHNSRKRSFRLSRAIINDMLDRQLLTPKLAKPVRQVAEAPGLGH